MSETISQHAPPTAPHRLRSAFTTSSAILVGLAFIATCAGYWWLEPDGGIFYPWFSLYTLQFALFVVILSGFHRGWFRWGTWWIVLGLAARALVIGSEPVMEADYFRYLWDGHVGSHGINPYAFAPEDAALDSIETSDRFLIQWMQYRTIYPAFSQHMFRLAHALAPDSLIGWKLLLFVYDVALAILLGVWIRQRGLPDHRLAWYLLNPLVLKETFNSAHLDVIAVFWVALAVYLVDDAWRTRWASLGCWVSLALGVGTKLYPIVLVPLLLQSQRRQTPEARWGRLALGPLILSGTLLLLYAPFVTLGRSVVESTGVFARYWTFNAGLFRVVDWLWSSLFGAWNGSSGWWLGGAEALGPTASAPLFYQLPAKLTVGLALLCWVEWQRRRVQQGGALTEACLSTLAGVLLLSPVVDAWYVLWILPLVVIQGHWGWLGFTYLVGMGYAWFVDPATAHRIWFLEYALLAACLAAWTALRRRGHEA